MGVLGPVEVCLADGRALALSALQRTVVALLVVHLDRPVPADRLVEAVWGATPPAAPAAALRNVVSRLRRQLPAPGLLVTEPAGYRLAVEPAAIDAYCFEEFVRHASRSDGLERVALLDRALALWRGPAYEQVGDREWFGAEAVRLEELRDLAREQRARGLVALDRAADAIGDLEVLVAEQPQREQARALLMESLALCGRPTDALERYERWRCELAERGLEPSPVLRDAELRVLRHTWSAGSVGERSRASVPHPISSFFGREEDLAELGRQLGRDRLVTLVGVGGVGKTRLAVVAAHALHDRYPDGTWFCDLAPARTDGEVAAVVATTIGVRDQGSDPLPLQLARHLEARTALVVLDNCERVLTGAALVAQALTTHTASVTVLATSRRRLSADGETVRAVEPLPAVDPDSAAGRLFADRRQALGGAPPESGDGPLMARICRKLDGLPLAIELAAARARSMTLAELERGLDQRFTLLVDEHRPNARHRSLEAMIAWSYDELGAADRVVFRQLGAFRGSFDLHAAADMLARSGMAPPAVHASVLTLVDASLLRWTVTAAGSRYSMLDCVREFAVQQLRAAEELEAVERHHADWALQLCHSAEHGLDTRMEATWAERLRTHIDDLRAAVDLLVRQGDDRALDMVAALHFFALWRAESEVFRWAERAAATLTGSASPSLPAAFATAATGAWQRGDLDAAVRFAQCGQATAASMDEEVHRRPLEAVAEVALLVGDLGPAIDAYSRARDLAIAAGDASQAVWDEGSRALAYAYGGNHADAVTAGQSALRLAETAASPSMLAFAHYVLAEIELDTAPALARQHLDLARTHASEADSRYVQALIDVSHANLANRAGDVTIALDSYESVLTAWQKTDSWMSLAVTVRSLVTLLTTMGSSADAAILYGAVAQPVSGPPPYGNDADRLAQAETALVRALGRQAFRELAQRGRALKEHELGNEALRAVRAASEIPAS